MTDVFIHIGYPKTGTTWLQQRFFSSINDVKYYGIKDKREDIRNDFILPNRFLFNSQTIRERYFPVQQETMIISHEALVSGEIHSYGLNGVFSYDLCGRLYSVFPKAKIIIFIRNQPDIIASYYNQYIRGGGNKNVNKYLYQKSFEGVKKNFFFSYDFFRYDLLISHYKEKFGEDNVYVFLYE